jgi:TetR/AcrR family transcriptional regulator, mexJK operon transcriptional repressor
MGGHFMAARDDQERLERRQQIIDGALAVFAEKGFDKATNQEIAEAAGIGSAGLIYHYFESKADLLRQVVASRTPMLQSMAQRELLLELSPREALRLIGSAFLTSLSDPENLHLFRIIVTEALRNPAMAEAWHQSSSRPLRSALIDYLAAGMRAGKLRPMDPEAAASCFMGPFVTYALSGEIFGRSIAQRLSVEVMVDTAIEIFLHGMEAA